MKHHPPTGAVGRARNLRKTMTDAERVVWRMLKAGFRDHHFRRQVPIRHYIADFASHSAKLVIEIDGGQHNSEVDAERTKIIEAEGYRVLRFWNNEVLGNPEGVWTIIDGLLRGEGDYRIDSSGGVTPPQTPPHQGEGL